MVSKRAICCVQLYLYPVGRLLLLLPLTALNTARNCCRSCRDPIGTKSVSSCSCTGEQLGQMGIIWAFIL